MFRSNKYDISNTGYTQKLDLKTEEYNALVNRAMRINQENGGKPTKAEAELYIEAIRVCEEISAMNVAQPAVRSQWEQRKMGCKEQVERIVNVLNPPRPVEIDEPEAQKEKQPVKKAKKSTDQEAAKTTKDGEFHSEHATKEVPIEDIRKWFKNDQIAEEGFNRVIGRQELQDRLMMEAGSIGWDKVDSALNIGPVQCYFFYGPPGSGKTFLIESFVGELKKIYKDTQFNFMQLTGSEVHASYVGIAEKIVTVAFKVAAEKAPCLIFMDEIDNLCVNREGPKTEGHEKRLTVAFLEAYNALKKAGKPIVFVGATNHPANVDSAMLDRITLIKIPLPDEKERAGFFDRMLGKKKASDPYKLAIEDGFTTAEMALATDNHSFRDMERVRDYMLRQLKLQVISEYSVTNENGERDQEASDEAASKAIAEGKVKITRALFEKAMKENPPSDKTSSRQEMKEFEDRIKRGE